MMRRLIGAVVFWLSWPAQWVYLQIGWRTRVVISSNGKILVIKGLISTGQWSLPGGGVHRGEDPITGAIREVREETGIELSANKFVKLYEGTSKSHKLPFKYICYTVELAERPTVKKRFTEIADSAWLKPEQITPQNSSPNTVDAVQSWLKR